MNKEFINQVMGTWQEDREFELYVRAWEAYYQASERIDGHIIVPQSDADRKLLRAAGRAGEAAMKEVFDDASYYDKINTELSKKAQKIALRRLGK